MILVKKIIKTPEGYEATWSLSEDQMNYLLAYAINDLLAEGVISVEELDVEAIRQQAQLDFLTDIDKESIPKA